MAIAPYFSKNALAIQHILKQGTYEEFVSLVDQHVVEIAFDESVQNAEGKATIDLLIKLIARLYPKIRVTDLSGSLKEMVQQVKKTATKINSKIEITDAQATISICLGLTPMKPNSHQIFYIGSDHWNVRISESHPVGSGRSLLPFAAGVSACIGAANVFRFIFAAHLRKQSMDHEVSFSLLDPHDLATQEVSCSDLGIFTIVGLGAIGSGCLWALQHLHGVCGRVNLVDNQKITESNLQRYVLAMQAEKGRQKTDMARQVLKKTLVEAVPYACSWNDYISKYGMYKEEMVITCLDTREDRMAVQASLPKHILNGYTDDGILGISRHINFLEQACINCMYTPKGERLNTSEVIAKDLGIPEHTIRELLYLDARVDEHLLRLIANANDIGYEKIRHFGGMPINTFYSEFICAGTLLEIKGSNSSSKTVEAPLAFQSALAGILLIVELYLFRSNVPYMPRFNRTHYNPLVAIKGGNNFHHHPLHKATSGRCICEDAVYKDIYRKKWNS